MPEELSNKAIAAVLEEIAVLLELAGENPFKARSYANAARQVLQSEEPVVQLARDDRLRELKGVGQALEQKLRELASTGRMTYHEELRAKFPSTLFELFAIPSLGAKRIKQLHDELGVSSLGELEYALNENRLLDMKGFGPKMQEKLRAGIAFAKRHRGRFLLSKALAEGRALLEQLSEHPDVLRIALAGSLRRCKETVKDIDIVASAERPDQLMAAFTGAPGVETVTGQGPTKSSVVLKSGMAADLRIVSDDQFPFALHHFTGSKEHNVRMRQRAKDRGMKVNEYGLFRGEALVPCADEEALFRALDLPWIPPELREDTGEFDAETLPNLVERAELNGIFHCHSDYSDGLATVEQMARAAQERGYSYLLMADHSQSAAYAGGLTPEEVARQHEEIDRVNAAMDGFVVLKGIESDIRADGSLDYPDEVLASFDAVVASVHSRLSMPIGEATDRLVRAVQNPYTTILGHPTGRLLLAREGYPVDFERLFDACAASGTAVEINASPHRLDLDWRQVKRARDRGVKLCIGPDAHRTEGLDDVNYGLGIARKGWLEASDLLNCMTLEEFLAWRK